MMKLDRAIQFAMKAHEGMTRKGKSRPYILHPLEVMTIVSALTDDEDVLCAAVLHDTVEDTDTSLEIIEQQFGQRVRELVGSESENKREDLPASETWRTRKQETINHLKYADSDVQMICLGDKLSNLREIARDYAQLGEELWNRFNQKRKSEHAWYYSTIYQVLKEQLFPCSALDEYLVLLRQVFEGNSSPSSKTCCLFSEDDATDAVNSGRLSIVSVCSEDKRNKIYLCQCKRCGGFVCYSYEAVADLNGSWDNADVFERFIPVDDSFAGSGTASLTEIQEALRKARIPGRYIYGHNMELDPFSSRIYDYQED